MTNPSHSHAHVHTKVRNTHTGSFTHVLLLFYLPYSTCFRQSAPARLKWILSRPFRFSAGDALMKGDSTIWTDQVAASSAQLRARAGDTPPPWNKRQVNRPLIYPLPFSLIPRRPCFVSVCLCVPVCACACVYLFVLVEHFSNCLWQA